MDYFQGVVTEFLRADRATFVNTECLIQLDPSAKVAKGAHWYCDAVAVNFRERAVYLCEVTYSTTLYALLVRLQAWSANWSALCGALVRDCFVPTDFRIQPWVFIPEGQHALLKKRIASLSILGAAEGCMPDPRITYLESVVPWRYVTWDRKVAALECEHDDSDSPDPPV